MQRGSRAKGAEAPPTDAQRFALRLALPAAAIAILLGGFLLREPAQPISVDSVEALAGELGAGGHEAEPDFQEVIQLPLERVDRLVQVGEQGACALGGRRAVCTLDGGLRWEGLPELPSRPLALAQAPNGDLLVAGEDGSILSLAKGEEPQVERHPMEERSVADAFVRDGTLYLLAHGFDSPADPMRLPRVIETVVLALRPDGGLDEVGSSPGFRGDRLLVQPDGTIVTFTSVDARSWRSSDGGATFRRLPDGSRFGADYGGLQIAVERWAHRIRGPGRPAHPASAVYVSRDEGESWDSVFDTNGEVIIDFRDATTGLVIARDEATAWLTTDGAQGFVPALRDDLLHGTVAVTNLGDHFLVATSDAMLIRIPIDLE